MPFWRKKTKRNPTPEERIQEAALRRGRGKYPAEPMREPVPKRKRPKRGKKIPKKTTITPDPTVSKRTWVRKKRKK